MIKRVDKAVDLTEELKKDVCGLRRGEAEPTCIKTSTRLTIKWRIYCLKYVQGMSRKVCKFLG